MKTSLFAATLALMVSLSTAQTAQVLELSPRAGVKTRTLVEIPASEPQAALVLMMGGNGQLGIYPNGSLQGDRHFLARVRSELTARGYVIALADVPSDRRELAGDFRDSAEHAADMGALIAHLRKAHAKPVWVVGHSRGTHSAVTAALRLAGDAA